MIHFQDNFYLTWNRNLVLILLFTWICRLDLSLGFVTWICLNLNWLLAVTGVMHEADDAYSILSTWSCYWLDQFLTLALNILILSIFTFQWICLPIILLILVGVELPLHVVVTVLECCVTFSGVKLSIRSFVLFLHIARIKLAQRASCSLVLYTSANILPYESMT